MICRCGAKIVGKIGFPGPKLPSSLAAVRHISRPRSASPPFFTNQFVLTTLRFCPSDLVALSYFLWCARQPHFFHDKPTFHHMVSVVSNLTHRYGSIQGIACALDTVGCVTKAQILLLLMRIYWYGALYDMVLEAFEEMINYGYIPNTYARNIVLDVLFKLKQVDLALRFLEEIPIPNFLSFNIAVCNLCKLGDLGNVKQVARNMLLRGYYLNPETYVSIIDCIRKFGRLREAFEVLGMMIVLGAPVSGNVWSILIDCVCRSGQVEYAAFLLGKMVEVGYESSANMAACTSVIKCLLESGKPGKAFEILETLQAKGCFPDLVLSNVLIDCFSKMGCYQHAFQVFCDLREQRLMPDAYTYSTLISTVCLSRQYVLLPLLTSGFAIQPDLVVCNSLLSYFCKAGYAEGAVELYDDMIDRGFVPDKYSFAAVLTALCRLGKVQEAVKVYRGIILSNGTDLDATVHTIMMRRLLKSRRFNTAMKVFREAAATDKFPVDVASYNVVIECLIKNGDIQEAYRLFCQMRATGMPLNPQHLYYLRQSELSKNKRAQVVMQQRLDRCVEVKGHLAI